MSWFPEEAILLDDDERAGEEVAAGVLVERREVLYLSLGALAALGLGWPSRLAACEPAGEAKKGDGELAWDQLLKTTIPLAEELVKAKKPNEEAYLHQVCALLAKLEKIPDAKFAPNKAVASANTYRKMPVVVVQFHLAGGAAIPYHDHRDYIGILQCVSGEARVRSFDVVGDNRVPPKGKNFEIRENARATLAPGRVSTLARLRDNIHDVRAGKDGARLFDFFTFFSPQGSSVYLNVDEKPKDADQGIYEASWK